MADDGIHIEVDGKPLTGEKNKRVQEALKKTLQEELKKEQTTLGFSEDISGFGSTAVKIG